MNSETDLFEIARQTRDPRFDGRFFVGVLTTGIYCRPVCPVRLPKRENVRIYPTAAAAAAAGFRPCLRCRPEASPGTPAWLGASHTVSRALQLIAQGWLDTGSVEELAGQLGIGGRHLSRLFRTYVGASPLAVAQTRRLHFAKQLLDETGLPMTAVCHAAGFGSLRRFNAVFQNTYGLSPSALRKRGSRLPGSRKDIVLRLRYRPPFDWRAMLEFFERRAIPEVEEVAGNVYRRTFNLDGKQGELAVSFLDDDNAALLQIDYPDTTQLLNIVERVRNLFDLKADSAVIDSEFHGDKILGPLVEQFPGIRVPGCWDGFEIAVRAIVGQQVSVSAATTLMKRLVERAGDNRAGEKPVSSSSLSRVFPSASTLAGADLSGLGITGGRVQAIRQVASAVADGTLGFDGNQDTDTFCERICRLKGVGDWTARYIALRSLRDPDAFLPGDLVLQRAAGIDGQRLKASMLAHQSLAWRPWRAYAVMLLWRHYQQSRLGVRTSG